MRPLYTPDLRPAIKNRLIRAADRFKRVFGLKIDISGSLTLACLEICLAMTGYGFFHFKITRKLVFFTYDVRLKETSLLVNE